ncbi:MAG: WG repeat-containing protein, partial [Bacteroidia bacterium]
MRNLFFVILLAACTYDHVDAQSFPETKKAPLGCLYGFVDTSGEWLIEPQYDDVRRFFDAAYKYYVEQDSSLNKIPLSQYRVVEKGGLKGLLNQELQTVLPLEFKTIAPKLYFDSMGLQYAPCDTLNLFGEFLLESPYHSAISHSYSFGIYYPALCSKTELYVQDTNNNWMVFNLKSKQLSPSFLQARWLDNQKVDDVQIFSAEDGVGIYRSETVIQLSKYNSLFPIFKNRLIAFQKDKLGLIDDMGNEVIACEYDSLVPTWFNGAIHFYKSGDLYVYNKDGNLLLKILDVKEVSRQLQTIKSIGDLFWFYSHSNEDFMQYGSMTIKNKKGKTWFINGSKEIVSFTHKDEIELASSSLRTKYYEVNGRDGKGVLAIISSSYQENKLIAQTLYQKIEVLESQNWFKLYTKDSVIIITDEGKHITTLARRSISSIYETWPGLSDLYTIQCKDGCRQFVSFNRLTYSNCGNELVLPANHISGGIVRLKRIDQRYLVLSSKGDTLTTKPIDTFFLKLKPGYWDKSEKYVDDIVLISGTELISLNKTLGYDHEKKEPIAKPYHAWTNDSLSFILDTNNKILKQFKGRASIHNRVYKRKKVFEVVYKMDTQFYVPVYKSNISKNDLDETSYSLLEKVGYYYKSNQELFANTFEYIRPVKGIGFVGADENYMLGLLDKNTNLLVKFKFYDDVIGLYGFNNKDSSFFLKHYAGMVAHKKGYKHNAYWKLYRLDKHGNLKELSHMRFDIPLPIENKSLFCDSDGDWGLMNANGYKTIINAHYNSANYQKGQAYFFLRLLQKSWNKQTNEPEFQRQYLVTDT